MFLVQYLTLGVLAAMSADGAVRITPKKDPALVEVSVDLPKDVADKLPAGKMSPDDGENVLQLCLMLDGKEGPAMLGTYQRDGNKLTFVPRVPLQAEKTYQAIYLQAGKKAEAVSYKVPARPAAPAAEVVAVWPTDDVLPANHLRFSIQFSRPMRGGEEIFKQIKLLNVEGEEISDAWLPDELWNEDGTVLTLLIHPGRIKWGVLLRMLLGPVLEPARRYTLVVSGDMLDADGRKLAKEFRKPFRAVDEDRQRIDLSKWKLTTPKIGDKALLVLTFPKALDHKCLARFLTVKDARGAEVAGKIEVAQDGRSWKFVPSKAWTDQEYTLHVDPLLEDVAGNTPASAFDVDVEAPVPPAQKMSLAFRPHK